MNRRYQIQATVARTEDGRTITKQIPTFYLHKDVQGIMDTDHAILIARQIIDPFQMFEVRGTATECE